MSDDSSNLNLEQLIASTPIQVLNDEIKRKLLEGFIESLPKSKFKKRETVKALEYFEILRKVTTFTSFQDVRCQVIFFCFDSSGLNLAKVVNKKTMDEFLDDEKQEIYDVIGKSLEFKRFREYFNQKNPSYFDLTSLTDVKVNP